jgi:AraC-like DNA-binding protein
MKSKYSSAAGLPTFNQLQKNKNRLQKGKDRLRGDGLKVSNVYLDIGYYSLSTSSVTFKKLALVKKRYG